jgi:hypothetical protein
MRAYAWIVIGLTIGILALRVSFNDIPIDPQPDREGKVTFRGPNYEFRVPREQFANVIRNPDHKDIVELSVDRREFGSPNAPGPRRISCTPGWTCTDYCAPTSETKLPPCPDIMNGWYRVTVIPASLNWGRAEWPHLPANAGPGFSCGDDGHPGLEFCWDPARYTPTRPVTDVHEVPYSAIRQSAGMTWVSIARDADGLPSFYTSCNFQSCWRFIEHAGATVRLDFAFSELSNWQRIEARLHSFAEHLIKPAPNSP